MLTHPKGTVIIANAQCLFVHSTHSCTRLVLRCYSYHSSVWYTPHLQHIIPMYIRYKSPTTSLQHAYWLYSCVNCTHLVRVRWSTPVCIIINWWPMQICGPMHSQSFKWKKLLIVLYLLHRNLLTIYNNTPKSFLQLQNEMVFLLQFTELEYFIRNWRYQQKYNSV